MRKAVRNSRRITADRRATLVLTLAALALSFACGGNTNFSKPTSSNPGPGVTLQNIKITPASSIILLTETRQLFAMGTYSDGSTVDISSSVTWGTNTPTGTTSFVTVNSSGIATATGLGATAITATLGSVTGVLQLTVGTNGFSSSTIAILQAPQKNSEIDVAYFPQQTKINGSYAVQVVNLDADQTSSFLPVPVALIASIAMPAGYVPNAAVASGSSSLVAVISYSSPAIQIIDASNNPLDTASNTLIATYKAPVTQSVTLNGTSCMICAAVVNPSSNLLILSTAQGFYSMNLTTGAFTQIPFTPTPAPSANITLDPLASPDPFILSVVPNAVEIQVLDLTTNAVTTYPNVGVTPTAGTIDITTQFSAVVDGTAADQTLIDFTNPQSPVISTQSGVGACPGGPVYMNMASLGVTPAPAISYLLTGQTGTTGQTAPSCVGVAQWPGAGNGLSPINIYYGFGPMPPSPDNAPFVMGSDPNAIATFTSAFNKTLYGLVVDGSQQWFAKINLGAAAGEVSGNTQDTLPLGANIGPPPAGLDGLTSGAANDTIVFLPTPSTQLTLSASTASPLGFGTVSVGTSSPQLTVTLTDISGTAVVTPQVSITGANAGDFALITNCNVPLQPLSKCAVYITFTPSSPAQESATLNVAGSGQPTQTVPLAGTGQ